MKYVKWAFLQAFMLITIASALGQVPDPYVRDYNFEFRIKGLEKDSVVYLANYYGDRQYYFDTTEVTNGRFTFKGAEIIGGIYSVIMQDRKSYFEFVVNEPSIAMETDTVDFVNRMTVKTSEENRSFYAYLQFINGKQAEAAPLRDVINTLPEDDPKRKKAEAKLRAIDSEVKAYKENYITKNPDFFSTKVFQTTDDPVVPRPPATAEDTAVWKYRYFKNHYFDLVDFEDERLLRTPVFHNKVTYYLNKLTVQHPDSIIISADVMAKKARATPEMFKYVVHTITNKYERSKVVCMDAVFVHMAKTYYCNGDAFWMTDKQTEKVCTRANAMAPLRCGQVAQNIILPDTSGTNWVNLHKIDFKFTVLLFWSPTCGHCKKAMPDFVEFYNN
ncbi:MAG: DUF5106 domain-containing protein, partial [Bacteroidota bacterium]